MYSSIILYTSLQRDLNLPPPPNNTCKGLLMIIFYLIQNTSGAKWPLSARKPGSGRTRQLEIYVKNPSMTSWGSVENSGRFTLENIRLRVNVRICAQLQSTYIILQLQKNRRKFRSQTSDLWTDAATVVKRVEEKKKFREDRARREKMKARAQSRKTERLSNVFVAPEG